jgi:hypothetical protein
MINFPPLRQLSRDYFEGQIDRDYYLRQRRDLIGALVAGNGHQNDLPSTATPGAFDVQRGSRPDSNDLANALAKREVNVSALEEAVSDRPASEKLQADSAEGGREEVQLPSPQSWPGARSLPNRNTLESTSEDSVPDTRRARLVIGGLLLALFFLVLWFIW